MGTTPLSCCPGTQNLPVQVRNETPSRCQLCQGRCDLTGVPAQPPAPRHSLIFVHLDLSSSACSLCPVTSSCLALHIWLTLPRGFPAGWQTHLDVESLYPAQSGSTALWGMAPRAWIPRALNGKKHPQLFQPFPSAATLVLRTRFVGEIAAPGEVFSCWEVAPH